MLMESVVRIQAERVPELTVPAQQAWAAYVRRRWPRDCVAHVQAEWDLSPGRARGAVFGTITQSTIYQIHAHPRGGPSVALDVLALGWNLSATALIDHVLSVERGKLQDEQQRLAETDARLVALSRRLSAVPHGEGLSDAWQRPHSDG